MAKDDVAELMACLSPYSPDIRSLVLWLREYIWDQYPEANEFLYDNYHAFSIGWSAGNRSSDAFCSISVFEDHVNLGFNRGNELNDPAGFLSGEGTAYRFLRFKSRSELEDWYVRDLLLQAYGRAPADRANGDRGRTIVKSVSPVKRRPGA